MTMNSSGPISIGGSTAGQSINLEVGRSATTTSSLNDSSLRTLAGVASGQISFSNFYGKSNDITSQYGLFAGGCDQSYNDTSTAMKISFNNFSSVATTSLSNYGGYGVMACSTSSFGIFMGGRSTTSGNAGTKNTTKFTYSGNTVAAATSLDTERHSGCAWGYSVYGMIGSGYIGPYWSMSASTTKYTYSNNSVAASTNLGDSEDYPDANGNGTVAYITSRAYSATPLCQLWTYSTSTLTTATNLKATYMSYGMASTATSSQVYFQGQNQANSYNLTNNTVGSITALGTSPFCLAAAGNGTVGLYHGGTQGLQSLHSYTYSNNTVTPRTATALSFVYHDATSNPPGSF